MELWAERAEPEGEIAAAKSTVNSRAAWGVNWLHQHRGLSAPVPEELQRANIVLPKWHPKNYSQKLMPEHPAFSFGQSQERSQKLEAGGKVTLWFGEGQIVLAPR